MHYVIALVSRISNKLYYKNLINLEKQSNKMYKKDHIQFYILNMDSIMNINFKTA